MRTRVALVTGAGSGIGRATARAFGAAGWDVALIGRTSTSLALVAAELRAAGARAAVRIVDLRDAEATSAVVANAADELGGLDAACNAAGIAADGRPLAAVAAARARDILDHNAFAIWSSLHAELALLQDGGSIVNVASTAGLKGFSGAAMYCASKHAVVGLTRAVALEVAHRGIRVNAVAPGAVETPMLARAEQDVAGLRARLRDGNPTGRIATAEEIAAAIVWLCSDAARYVTGAVLPIDGGATAG